MSKVRLLVDMSFEISFYAHYEVGQEFKVVGKDGRGLIAETKINGERKTFTLAYKHLNEYWEYVDD